jgi:predicted transcriptional regulator
MQRTTVSFDRSTTSRLSRLAHSKGISNVEVVRRAVALYELVERERSPESEVAFLDRNGEQVSVVMI